MDKIGIVLINVDLAGMRIIQSNNTLQHTKMETKKNESSHRLHFHAFLGSFTS